ncbi:hypothetical protein BU15DRAFT_78127 [Melanogaster broomeanus]|nr:hypothetical protein BU15DRAFT_78127 [Melanogaster broomeanus]
MSNSLVTSAWAPGLIGFAFASSLYGIALGQSIYYARHFPDDPASLSSWGMFVAIPINYATTFAVQSFYCRRVWIISGNKKHITIAIFVTAILQFGLGGWCALETIRVGTIDSFFNDRFILYAAAVSTLCDFLITGAVFKYMYNSDLRRRVNFIQDLAIVFINMGALTCLMSIVIGIIFLVQGDNYWVGAPGFASADASYVNSNLAVLNARRSIRQREERRHGRLSTGFRASLSSSPLSQLILSHPLGVSAWAGPGVLFFVLFILITVVPVFMRKAAPWFMRLHPDLPRGLDGIRVVMINSWEDHFLAKLEDINNRAFSWPSSDKDATPAPAQKANSKKVEDSADVASVSNVSTLISRRAASTMRFMFPAPFLCNVNISIQNGSLTAIVGNVGSGKSSLLSAIIGEVMRVCGDVHCNAFIAYCASNHSPYHHHPRQRLIWSSPQLAAAHKAVPRSSHRLQQLHQEGSAWQGACLRHPPVLQLKPIRSPPDGLRRAPYELHRIILRAVYHSRPDKPVLRNVNIAFEAGEIVCIVGRTGSGNSTLSLLLRMIESYRVPSRLMAEADLHRCIIDALGVPTLQQGMQVIMQDPFIFSILIRSSLGLEDKHDDKALWHALVRRLKATLWLIFLRQQQCVHYNIRHFSSSLR